MTCLGTGEGLRAWLGVRGSELLLVVLIQGCLRASESKSRSSWKGAFTEKEPEGQKDCFFQLSQGWEKATSEFEPRSEEPAKVQCILFHLDP